MQGGVNFTAVVVRVFAQEPPEIPASLYVLTTVHARRMTYVLQLSPILVERRGQLGGTISGGQQQMAD